MSSKTASVKLTLEASSYMSQMRRVGDASASAAKNSGRAWEVARAGLQGMKGAAQNMLGSLKSMLSTAATLGGALSAGKMFSDAVKMQSAYRDLAFRVGMATKASVSWQEIQAKIEPIARKTARSSEELAEAFGSVLGEVGDAKFAEASIGAIGTIATATGRPVAELASIAGSLGDKFGVTADQIPDALASVIEFANRGGVQMEDLTQVLNITGASARAAGMMGEQGFRRMIAMANMGGDALGTLKKGLSAISGLVDQLAQPETAKALKLNFGVDTKDSKGRVKEIGALLGEVMRKTKGNREKLAKVFSGEQLKLVTELGRPFRETYDSVKGNEKQKLDAATEAFKSTLDQAGKTSFGFAEAQKEAAKRAKDDPTVKYREAMERLSQAMQKPEIINAINDLAKNLPKLAEVVAQVVTLITKHPALAGGAYVGAKVGAGGAQAMLGQMWAARALRGAAPAAPGAPGAPPVVGTAKGAGGGAMVAGAAAAAGVALAVDQADKLRQETGMKTSVSDFLPGMKGGSFSPEQLLKDMVGIGMVEKSMAFGHESAAKLTGMEMKRGTGRVAFEAMTGVADSQNRDQGLGASPERSWGTGGSGGPVPVTLPSDFGSDIGRALSNTLGAKTLRVEVTNMPAAGGPGGGSGARGPLDTPPTRPGYGGG